MDLERYRGGPSSRWGRSLTAFALTAAVVTLGAASPAGFAADAARSGGATPPAGDPRPSPVVPGEGEPLDGAPCDRVEIEYALGAGSRVRVSDTLLGAGDGDYDVASGALRVRYTAVGGKPAPGDAELLSLKVAFDFTAVTKVVGLKTQVRTVATARNTPDRCGIVARGAFDGSRLTFREAARGYRSEGKLYCEGALCGRFGAPPPGESSVVVGPFDASYRPLVLTDGMKALTMDYSEVARGQSPRQTTSLRLVAREVKRSCVAAPSCP